MPKALFQKILTEFTQSFHPLSPKELALLTEHALFLKSYDFLTGNLSLEQLASDLFCDSLQLLPELQRASAIVDLGTGGGIPGLILAIPSPQKRFLLLDSQERKIRALQEFLAGRIHNATPLWARAETYAREHRESAEAITVKGFRLARALEMGAPLLSLGGVFLALQRDPLPKKEALEKECKILGLALVSEKPTLLPSGKKSLLITFRKVAPTPLSFPRPFPQIKRSPLF